VRLTIMAYTVWLGVISCGGTSSAPPAYAPVTAPCTPLRVGKVTITGAARTLVPSLAVLEGTIEDPLRSERITAAAIEALQARGYARAKITVARDVGCFTDLRVAVELGPRFKIDRIDFDTDDAFPIRERLSSIEDALGAVNTVGGAYIEYRMERALAVLERRYHDAGWLEARVSAPVAVYDERGTIKLTVPIAAGPRFRIGAIRARGAGAAARAAVLEEIDLEPGAWYDGPAIRHGVERARRRLDRWVELRTVSVNRGEIDLEAVLEAHTPGSAQSDETVDRTARRGVQSDAARSEARR
jgi:outer membrane protein assembly factor BamA